MAILEIDSEDNMDDTEGGETLQCEANQRNVDTSDNADVRREDGRTSTSSSSSDSSSIIPKKLVNVTVSQDAAWSRRTRGMNSNSVPITYQQDMSQPQKTTHPRVETPLASTSSSSSDSSSITPKKLVNVTVSQDAAWSRRTRGMNSNSGFAHVIGHKTRRCLDYSTRNKKCWKCEYYQKRGKKPPPHDCRRNWSRSSKAMEGDIAVQLHKQASKEGLHYKHVIGDEDSSSMKQIHDQHDADVSKYSDFSHIKRTLYNKLESLQKNHKSLSATVRQDFVKNFTYAVHQNKGMCQTDMENALRNIIPHMYGEHDNCGSWCRYKKEENYHHTGLPRGQDLTDDNLRKDLEGIIDVYARNAQKLLTTGDSQANESLNSVAWSKAPKIRNYTCSESFDYRMASAVCQFNDGPEYVCEVIGNAGLTPQKTTEQYNMKEARQRRYAKLYKQRRSTKRKRISLKNERATKQTSIELREGTTYKTNCGETIETDLDVEYIPEYEVPEKLHIDGETNTSTNKVYFDIETTGLNQNAEITQISAWYSSDTSFTVYTLPSKNIEKTASELTGLTIKYVRGEKKMFYHDNEVDAFPVNIGLMSFLQWLEKIPGHSKILLAHNCKRFDMRFLIRALAENGLISEFKATCIGFVDTLPLIRAELPGRKSYKLELVYKDLINDTYACHNATEDTKALASVVRSLAITEEKICQHSLSTASAIDYVQRRNLITNNLKIVQDKLCRGGTITKSMAKKICESGLTYRHLLKAHERDISNGIRAILTEKLDNGKVRVTNRRQFIENIINHFNGQ